MHADDQAIRTRGCLVDQRLRHTGRAGAQCGQIDRQQAQLLADVVVQLARNPCAFRFLGMQQSSAKIANSHIAGLELGLALAQRAQFQGVAWLNINSLAKALHQVVQVGEILQIDLVKAGREPGQAVGFQSDGSMVVVDGAAASIGKSVMAEVASIVPTAGGKMIFARPVEKK